MADIVEFPGDGDNWREFFANGKSPTKGSVHDAYTLLRWHPATSGKIAFNVFASQIVATSRLPWHPSGLSYPRQIDDTDGTRAATWFETQGLFKVGISTAKACLVAAGRDRPFNPLVDWLQSITWDRKARIETWLTYYLGVDDSAYARAVGPKFLIGGAARALKPGSKVDTMLILEGPQGRFKSTAARTLFGADWYTDDLADLHSKDAALQMQGRWGIEISELAAMSRSESNRIKAVLSRQVDRFRAPYDRFVAEHPRQCVFIGTTNPVDGYFRDPTGGRRFWPVACGTIDKDALANDREQLWAEAVERYFHGANWWLEGEQVEAAHVEQAERREVDPWEELILDRLGGQTSMSVNHVLIEWLGVPKDRVDKNNQMRVASIFRAMGWERVKRRINGEPAWIWQKGGNSSHLEGTLL